MRTWLARRLIRLAEIIAGRDAIEIVLGDGLDYLPGVGLVEFDTESDDDCDIVTVTQVTIH